MGSQRLSIIIKKYRHEHGMIQKEFAKKCGVSPAYISCIENEKNPTTGEPIEPKIETYEKLAYAMDISVDELLSMVDNDKRLRPIFMSNERARSTRFPLPSPIRESLHRATFTCVSGVTTRGCFKSRNSQAIPMQPWYIKD